MNVVEFGGKLHLRYLKVILFLLIGELTEPERSINDTLRTQ
jgi:hypothetical protein